MLPMDSDEPFVSVLPRVVPASAGSYVTDMVVAEFEAMLDLENPFGASREIITQTCRSDIIDHC